MKKVLSVLGLLLLVMGLSACGETAPEAVVLPETVSMSNVDEYLFDGDWQFVDLRNFDDQMADGWVRGFEFIPFFDYLEYTDILVRTNLWTFEGSNNILNESALKALFDEDKVIVLMCAGGARAGFVKDALEYLGYENVYNAGALSAYKGDHRVFGDGEYAFDMPIPESRGDLPLSLALSDEAFDLYVTRSDVQFVDLRNFTDKMNAGWHIDSTIIPFFDFLEANDILVRLDGWNFTPETIKNETMLRSLFVEDMYIVLICAGGIRAEFVKLALEHLGYEHVYNAGGFSSYEGNRVITPGECPHLDDDDPSNDCE
jgi:rhodanese-related sulfurtransferase